GGLGHRVCGMMKRLLEWVGGKNLSDDAYVERLGGGMKARHKLGILKLEMKMDRFSVLAVIGLRSVLGDQSYRYFQPGFRLGLMVGFLCGLLVSSAIWQLLAVFALPLFAANRESRLLIEYHDLLRTRENPAEKADLAAPRLDATPLRQPL